MTDTNNWLQEVERVLADLGINSQNYSEMRYLLRQAVTMVKAQGADVLPPRVEPVAWRWKQDPFGANEWHYVHENPHDAKYEPLYAHPPSSSEPAGGEAWQDIRTAPKDIDTFILVYAPEWGAVWCLGKATMDGTDA